MRKPFVEIVDRIVQDPSLLDSAAARGRGTVAMRSEQGGFLSGCEC